MTKETYRLRGMTDKQWQELMRGYDKRIEQEKKSLEERKKMFDD